MKTFRAVAAGTAILVTGAFGAFAEEQDVWTYDASTNPKTITDGVWVLNVTESKDELTVTGQNAAMVVGTDMTCDLSKPVEGGKPIVGIGGSAFANKTNLKVMKFPETMRTIGADAFKSCSKLTTITPFMPAAVTTVGQQAFWSTSLAGDLVLGEKDGPELTLSGVRSFCSTKITSVTIEAPLKSGTLPASFGSCTALTNVVLRGNVTTISSGAFGSCAKLTDFHVSTFVKSWAADAISGPAAYGMRLWVDKSNPNWRIWIASNVTPWDELGSEAQAKYDENFGTDAPRPVGLVTGATAQPASQWVMLWDQGGEPVLWPMEVSATGYEGLEDGEPHGITVNVTTPQGGFGCSYEWSADGGETWSTEPTNFVAAGVYTVTCRVSAEDFETTEVSATVILHGTGDDHWTYNASTNPKTITDGVWVLSVTTDSSGKLTVTGVAAGTDYRSDMTCDLTKPIDGDLEIVALAANAFNGYNNKTGANLTSIKFPETLQSIGGDAFKSCSKLTTVTPFLPAALTSLGNQAFYDCTSLTGAVVIGEVDSSEVSFGTYRVFSGNKITSATINADVKGGTLPQFIFNGCSMLTNVVLRGNVTTISSSAFANCTKLTDFYVSSFVTSWASNAGGPDAFKMRLWVDKTNPEWKTWVADDTKVLSWDGLDPATKAKYDENFGTDAPRPVGLVTGTDAQPASQWVMLWDQGGEPVLWPMEVSAAGYEGLVDGQPHNITVTVTKPVGGAGCSYKWSLNGGETWSDDLPNLTEAGVYTVTCQVSAEGFETTEVSATVILHGAADDHWAYDSVAKTITDGVWVLSVTESKGELTIKGVAAGTDYRSGMEADLTKPVSGGQTIVALGDSAFNGFGNKTGANLTSIKFPETLRSIGGDAFKSCSQLTTVTPFLPAALTSIGNQAFYDCRSLTGDVVIEQVGGSEVSFGMYRVFNGTKITSATIDAAVKGGALPQSIFAGCSKLTNVVLRAGVTTISSGAFASCAKLADLYLGAYVTSWAADAFSNGPADYTMRLWVDMYGKEWDAWIAENVTPWNELDGETQALYYANFGAGAKRPVGLVTGEGAQPANQWVLRWYPNGPKPGFMLLLK